MTSATIAVRPDQHEIRRLANAIRVLSMDAVEAAKSGHPGLPLGMADVATVLFSHFLKFDAADPGWPDRDRFVLSAGHGSMLLYSLLWLTGYPGITLEDLKTSAKSAAPAPAIPNMATCPASRPPPARWARASPMPWAWRWPSGILNARFGDELVDHKTYVIASDGDLMEGISHEAISPGRPSQAQQPDRAVGPQQHHHRRFHRRCRNPPTQIERFKAAGWTTDTCDGHDAADVFRALNEAQNADRPVMIACRTIIGFGMPGREGTQKAHSDAPGAEEVAGARKELGWDYPPFVVPDDLLNQWRAIGKPGARRMRRLERRAKPPASRRKEFDDAINGVIPASLAPALVGAEGKAVGRKAQAGTRKCRKRCWKSSMASCRPPSAARPT